MIVASCQVHKDQTSYLRRVKNKAGIVLRQTQIELNKFIKTHYTQGLRSNNNSGHAVRLCNPHLTQAKEGSSEYLWFISNTEESSATYSNYTYSATTGATYNISNVSTSGVNTGVLASNFSMDNCSIGVYIPQNNKSSAYLGTISGSGNDDSRFTIFPMYVRTQIYYFEVGTPRGNTREVNANFNNDNNKGLAVCSKSNNIGYVNHRKSEKAKNTSMGTGDASPANNLLVGRAEYTANTMKVSGYWFGNSIEESKINILNDIWESIQKSVNSSRGF
ncbi:MAG: hypothetical protein AAF316_00135 [Cyanobacteria bacterium P01_A01_bin.80]